MAVSTKEDEHLQFPVKLGIGGFGMGAAVKMKTRFRKHQPVSMKRLQAMQPVK